MQRQVRFANTSRAGEREQAYLRAAEQRADDCHLLLAPNERGEGYREVSRKSCGMLFWHCFSRRDEAECFGCSAKQLIQLLAKVEGWLGCTRLSTGDLHVACPDHGRDID